MQNTGTEMPRHNQGKLLQFKDKERIPLGKQGRVRSHGRGKHGLQTYPQLHLKQDDHRPMIHEKKA